MRLRISHLIAAISAILMGCESKQPIDFEAFTEKANLQLDQERYVLVVPQHGCSNCVKKAYDFIIEHYHNQSIDYVFTHYSSKKAVRVRFKILGIEDTSRLSFIELSAALDLGLSQMYPALISLTDKGTASVTIMNDDEGKDWLQLQEDIAD